jgi:hypothetical protein
MSPLNTGVSIGPNHQKTRSYCYGLGGGGLHLEAAPTGGSRSHRHKAQKSATEISRTNKTLPTPNPGTVPVGTAVAADRLSWRRLSCHVDWRAGKMEGLKKMESARNKVVGKEMVLREKGEKGKE